MTTMINHQLQAVRMGAVPAATPGFVPLSDYPELEAAREAHERAVEEHRGVDARRRQAREEERKLREHLASVQAGKHEVEQAAKKQVKGALIDALGVVGEHGETWLRQIATERAAALEEREVLLAKASALEIQAHRNDHLEVWLHKTMTSSVPRAFRADAVAVPRQRAEGARGVLEHALNATRGGSQAPEEHAVAPEDLAVKP